MWSSSAPGGGGAMTVSNPSRRSTSAAVAWPASLAQQIAMISSAVRIVSSLPANGPGWRVSSSSTARWVCPPESRSFFACDSTARASPGSGWTRRSHFANTAAVTPGVAGAVPVCCGRELRPWPARPESVGAVVADSDAAGPSVASRWYSTQNSAASAAGRSPGPGTETAPPAAAPPAAM